VAFHSGASHFRSFHFLVSFICLLLLLLLLLLMCIYLPVCLPVSSSGTVQGLGLPSDSASADRMNATLTAAVQADGVQILTGAELVGVENGQWSETGGYVLLKTGGQVARRRAKIVGTACLHSLHPAAHTCLPTSGQLVDSSID
jgi:hypothetical protein